MHKSLVELNKAINAGAVSENVIENEKQRKEPSCPLVISLSTVHGWVRQDSLPLSQECKIQLAALTLLLPVGAKRGQSL